jgi:hypothetical protein
MCPTRLDEIAHSNRWHLRFLPHRLGLRQFFRRARGGTQENRGIQGTRRHDHRRNSQGRDLRDFLPRARIRRVQRIDNEGVLEFRKYSRLVTAYPPHLTIQISIRASVCDADVFTPAPNPEFLKTLHFKVQWKRQLYLRPVESYTIQTVPLTLDESESRELVVVQIYDSGNVPLTDHLILTALSPGGKILSRMAAHL